MSTRRAYRNGQLVDGFDMAGEFDNLGKQPRMEIETYNPVTNKKQSFSNRDYKQLFQESSPNSLETNLTQLLTKSLRGINKTRRNKKSKRRRKRQTRRRQRRRVSRRRQTRRRQSQRQKRRRR